jgi:hypothetical protein
MPDWKKLVRERIGSLLPPHCQNEDVIAEVAAYLEEVYESARARGLDDSAAAEDALREVQDWSALAREIRRTKSEEVDMNRRTRALWLPGTATLFRASLLLVAVQLAGFQPHFIRVAGISVDWPWMTGLPLFGAIGAYLSRRAEGAAHARLVAALFPALIMLVVICLVVPYGLMLSGISFFRIVHCGHDFANGVVMPAVALLAGAAPFLLESSIAKNQPRAA